MFFLRAISMHVSAAMPSRVSVYPSVCPSVTLVCSVEASKHNYIFTLGGAVA